MLLVYIDETGISYQKNTKQTFIDGPFAIWGGILVPESKYFHLERLFAELLKKYLNVGNWRKIEVHATDLWNGNPPFDKISKQRRGEYFEELIQLVTKLRIDTVFGIQQKNIGLRSNKSRDNEILLAPYSFFTALEHKLSEKNETAVLIADISDKKGPIQKLLYQRTKWRFNPGEKKSKFKSKYFFENHSCFLLDQIHYVDSKLSFFTIIIDHLCYVMMRVLTYSYLNQNPSLGIQADINKVPISSGCFNFYTQCISVGAFSKSENDVVLEKLSIWGDGYQYLKQEFTSQVLK